MSRTVLHADVEALIVEYLGSALAFPVCAELVEDRPAAFVLVRRTGGVPRSEVSDEIGRASCRERVSSPV